MHISIGRNTENNMKLLGIESFPFSEQTIKTNFRTLAFQYHPDHNNGNEEASKKFQKIKEAYDALINLATCVTAEQVSDEMKKQDKAKEDMFELYEQCSSCEGNGEKFEERVVEEKIMDENKIKSKEPCIFCRNIPCRKCNNGVFTLKNGRKVTCLKCMGVGRVSDPMCFWCRGFGSLGGVSYKKIRVRVKCGHCNGTGKVKVDPFNPVIPKGGIMI